MNKFFITLQMLGISLTLFSQLCATAAIELHQDTNNSAAQAIKPFCKSTPQEIRKRIFENMRYYNCNSDLPDAVFTPAFEDAVENLSRNTHEEYRHDVIRSLAKVQPENLANFTILAKSLSQSEFRERADFAMIETLAVVPANRLTQEFINAVERLAIEINKTRWHMTPNFKVLTQKRHFSSTVVAIEELGKAETLEIRERELNSIIEKQTILDRLLLGLDKCCPEQDILLEERLSPAFEETVNRLFPITLSDLIDRPYGSDLACCKTSMIYALAIIPADRLAAFEQIANKLTQELTAIPYIRGEVKNVWEKCQRIKTLSIAFEEIANRLCNGLDKHKELSMIRTIANMPADTFSSIAMHYN